MVLPKCVRVDVDDEQSAAVLLEDGWREIEVLVQLERKTERMIYSDRIHPLNDELMEATVELARNNMGPNRFITDGLLDETVAMGVREKWIRDKPENVYVFVNAGDVFGFFVQAENHLDLIVVDHVLRKIKIGTRMTQAFIDHAWEMGHQKVTVGTQDNNLPALMLYWGLGFEIVGKRRTFHK